MHVFFFCSKDTLNRIPTCMALKHQSMLSVGICSYDRCLSQRRVPHSVTYIPARLPLIELMSLALMYAVVRDKFEFIPQLVKHNYEALTYLMGKYISCWSLSLMNIYRSCYNWNHRNFNKLAYKLGLCFSPISIKLWGIQHSICWWTFSAFLI